MDKYSGDFSKSSFDSVKSIFLAEVVSVGKITSTDKDIRRLVPSEQFDKVKQSLERYNADDHAIKVVIQGTKYDGAGTYTNVLTLPNCFPLLPKHLNVVPQKGEMVLVMLYGDDARKDDRFYIGPIISSRTKLNKDLAKTSISNFTKGIVSPTEDISRVPLAKGVYENKQNVVIEGRGSTDIIQRDNEILLRSGKFVPNDRLRFNNVNPGFIQIKSDFNNNNKNITVTNIVSDKINLLTYNGTPSLSGGNGLTKVDKKTDVAEYIDDVKLQEILEEAHPLVFGDLLIEYLKLLKDAILNHVHNGSGGKPTDLLPASTIKNIYDKAEILEKSMLSKNIRIN